MTKHRLTFTTDELKDLRRGLEKYIAAIDSDIQCEIDREATVSLLAMHFATRNTTDRVRQRIEAVIDADEKKPKRTKTTKRK